MSKLKLNQDILEEIVPHFNVWGKIFFKEPVELEALKKFMLSGKEAYEATLRYFSHVDTVHIALKKICITVKRHILEEEYGSNLYQFPYDFSMLDDILRVLEKSNTKIEIEDYPSSTAGRKALARLTQKPIIDFSRMIVESMPNLNKLVVELSAPEQPRFSWTRVYEEMKKFNSEIFQHIPSEILKILPKNDPGVDIDAVKNQLIKKFDIHDGLVFKFVLQFSGYESEEDSDLSFEHNLNEIEEESESDENEGSDYFVGEEDALNADEEF
uniref:Uncharacterized protein n=1 Tax=Panagrolaimus sp. ES5 TaxID=591445 RepID=A0AC34GWW2_9BILA